jgi:anti-anti-sigma regulatory factor
VIDCSSINFVDTHGSEKLSQIITLADRANVSLWLARVNPAVLSILEADGVVERLGDGHIQSTVDHAVRAALGERDQIA